jgi:hypothetical protein
MNLFNYFSKQQKSALCHSIKSYVKKNIDKDNLVDLYLEDEEYYIELDSSRVYFIKEYLEDTQFLKDLNSYFYECQKYYEYQKKLEPYKQQQKEFAKEQRKKARDFKRSKEPPTKKQISYYKALCQKYNIELKDLTNLSKLDLINLISGIKNEYQRN